MAFMCIIKTNFKISDRFLNFNISCWSILGPLSVLIYINGVLQEGILCLLLCEAFTFTSICLMYEHIEEIRTARMKNFNQIVAE